MYKYFSRAGLNKFARNKEETNISYLGINLKIKKEAMPAIEPKIKPFNLSYPEVFGSISIMKRKNQLIILRGLMPEIKNRPIKKLKKPKI